MRMKSTLWALAFACAAVSCSDDFEEPNGGGEGPGLNGETAKINILINTEAETKAVPGEDGDNTTGELGSDEENKVHDITLILYSKPEGSADTDPWTITKNCKLVAAGWTDKVGVMEGSNVTAPETGGFPHGQMTTIQVSVADPTASLASDAGTTYGVIAVTNLGSDDFSEGIGSTYATVGDLDKTLFADRTEGSKFVMSTHAIAGSAGASTVTLKTDGSIPSTVAYVERLSAKIRISEHDNNAFKYTNGDDVITLDNVAIVNQLKSKSFLLKCVSPALKAADDDAGTAAETDLDLTTSDNDVIIGKELGSATEAATNFVIDPWTRLKIKKDVAGTLSYTGTTPASTLGYTNPFKGDSYGAFWTGLTAGEKKALDATKTDAAGDLFLCYTQENTTSAVNSLNGYSTGAVFQATYYPKKWSVVQTDGSVTTPDITDAEYDVSDANTEKVPVTFYLYNGDIYKNYESVLAMFLKQGTVSYASFVKKDGAFDTNFGTNINSISNTDPFGYIAAMKAEYAKETDEDEGTTPVYQEPTEYLTKVRTELANANSTDWTAEKKQALYESVKTYTNGVCYYPYWIKHADNGKRTVMGVMEFAIVRNNIYDMTVTGINKLGLSEVDVPDPTDPDEDGSLRIMVSVYVKNWVVRTNGDIIL